MKAYQLYAKGAKRGKTMQDRKRLYLSNFSILNVEPGNSLTIEFDNRLSEAAFQTILSLAKQWYIKNVSLKPATPDDRHVLDYINTAINEQFLFTAEDFEFQLDISHRTSDLLDQFWQNELFKGGNILMPFIIHTANYEICHQAWGKDLVRFNDFTPEVYREISVKSGHINFRLPHAIHVVALFAAPAYERKTKLSDLQDITTYLNRSRGFLHAPWTMSKKIDLYVVRLIDGWFDSRVHFAINYASSDFLSRFFEYMESRYSEYLSRANEIKVSLPPFESTADCIPASPGLRHLFGEGETTDFWKQLLSLWHYFPDSKKNAKFRILNYQKRSMNQLLDIELSRRRNAGKKRIHLVIDGNTSPQNKDLQLNAGSTCIQLDYKDATYSTPGDFYDNEMKFRLAVSRFHLANGPKPVFSWSSMLNLKNSFQDKLGVMHWLMANGVSYFNLNISFSDLQTENSMLENIPTADPAYHGYPVWYAYLNQMAHYLRSGTHRADILVLDTEESAWCGEVTDIVRIAEQLAGAGLDFDVIDYSLFCDKNSCRIDGPLIRISDESYSFLILPGVEKIPLEVLEKIHAFFESGGTVICIGRLPQGACEPVHDRAVNLLTNEIWFQKTDIGSTKFKTSDEGGRGYYQTHTEKLVDVLLFNTDKIKVFLDKWPNRVYSLVRELPTAFYIYLFNAHNRQSYEGTLYSRYKGKPFYWDFEKINPEPLWNWKIKDHLMHIPLSLDPQQSVLFLLKKASLKAEPQIIDTNFYRIETIETGPEETIVNGLVEKNGEYKVALQLHSKTFHRSVEIEDHVPALKISDENWQIEYGGNTITGNLGDLNLAHPFFSGSAVYRKVIVLPEEYFNNYKLILHLGKVRGYATVTINQKEIKDLIFAPFTTDVTEFLRPGENRMQFELRNNLSNRLAKMPGALARGYLVREFGLFGPVRIIPQKRIGILFS